MADEKFTPTAPAEATTATPATAPKTYTHRGYTLTLTDAGLTVQHEGRHVGEAIGMSKADALIDADVAQRKARNFRNMGRSENDPNTLI